MSKLRESQTDEVPTTRLIEIVHEEALAFASTGYLTHGVTFTRTSYFMVPSEWLHGGERASLAAKLERVLESLYHERAEANHRGGDLNHMILLEGVCRPLAASELAEVPWKRGFYALNLEGSGRAPLSELDDIATTALSDMGASPS